MSAEDLRVKCEIRNILVQNWVDTTRLNVSCHRGIVSLRGTLSRVKREQSMVSSAEQSERDMLQMVLVIEDRVRRIRDVRRVVFDLDNFKKVGMKWQKT